MTISRRGVAAGLAGLALARGLPARAQEPPAWLDQKLLAAARKEGPLTVYSSTNEQEGLPLFKIFEDAAGIKFNYIRGNDASLSSRIAIETRAKQPSFDIVHMTNAHKMPQALLAQFDPPEAKHINPLAHDPGRRWYGVYTVYTTPAYNTKLVSKADVPKSFEEFAQRKEWAGRVAIDHTDIEWLRGMMQFYGEQKGTALVREIAANLKPVLTDGRLAMARSVAAGEYLFALSNFVNLTLNVKLPAVRSSSFRLIRAPLLCAGRGQRKCAESECSAACRQLHAQPGLPSVLTQNSVGFRRAPTSRPPARRHQAGDGPQGHPHAVLAGGGKALRQQFRRVAAQAVRHAALCPVGQSGGLGYAGCNGVSRGGRWCGFLFRACRLLALVAIVLPLALATGSSEPAKQTKPWNSDPALLAAAQKEGNLVVYSSTTSRKACRCSNSLPKRRAIKVQYVRAPIPR
jgi:hypothetical protein